MTARYALPSQKIGTLRDAFKNPNRSPCDTAAVDFAQTTGAIAMPYIHKSRGKRNTSSQSHPVALMSAYRYKSMLRAIAAQKRAQHEGAKVTAAMTR